MPPTVNQEDLKPKMGGSGLRADSGLAENFGPLEFDNASLRIRLGLDDASPAHNLEGQQPPSSQQPEVVTVTRREMTMIRSALPSPNKNRGKKLSEEMGIKNGKGDNALTTPTILLFMLS